MLCVPFHCRRLFLSAKSGMSQRKSQHAVFWKLSVLADSECMDTMVVGCGANGGSAYFETVRRLRLDRNLSQAKFAKQARLSRQAHRNIGKGSSLSRVSTLENLAKALDVSLGDLVKPVNELHGVRFRARKKMTHRDNILAQVSTLLEDHNDLE